MRTPQVQSSVSAIRLLWCCIVAGWPVALGACLGPELTGRTAAQLESDALCLLQPVGIYGQVAGRMSVLPVPLAGQVGRPFTSFTATALQGYLRSRGIAEADLGGLVSRPLRSVRYFILHDTSTPYLANAPFPANLDQRSWPFNTLTRWQGTNLAHVFVNRLGDSLTAQEFTNGNVVGTKFSARHPELRGLFIHIENVQPRRRDPRGGAGNDALAPTPGFSLLQYRRLALLYLTASRRAGVWLAPGFHANVDRDIPDAHDDPQQFSLETWAAALSATMSEIQSFK